MPLVAAIDPEHLPARVGAGQAQELPVRPFAPGELEARVRRARRDVNGVEAEEVVRAGRSRSTWPPTR